MYEKKKKKKFEDGSWNTKLKKNIKDEYMSFSQNYISLFGTNFCKTVFMFVKQNSRPHQKKF
jgi:hypothetical protein